MKVLVTGANGFIGRHIVEALRRRGDEVWAAVRKTSESQLRGWALEADVIVHLAGTNRPIDEEEFSRVNRDLTQRLVEWLNEGSRTPTVVFSSSTQAGQNNPYGKSKLAAEEALDTYSGPTRVFRLPNVFGKGCRPNYNSVIATFCHNTAHGLPINIDDPDREVTFVYVDDVVDAFLNAVDSTSAPGLHQRHDVEPQYKRTLGRLGQEIQSFRDMRSSLRVPDFADRFLVSLYATYLSCLPSDEFAYSLEKKSDARGSLAEFMKSEHFGQIFVSRTHPGITRGNHFHHTKTEKFLVLEGRAVVRFRHFESGEVLEYPVTGEEYRVIDIPPGYTHSIENIGETELVTLFWASEIFDPEHADTTFEAVLP